MGGPENDNLDKISYFTPHCVDFGTVLFLFVVKESICASFEKIRPSVFVINGRLSQNWSMRALCV